MTATNSKSSDGGTGSQSAGKTNDRWPLKLRLLMSAAFACLAAIGIGGAMCDGDLWLRIKFGSMGLACVLGVIGFWFPLGRWSAPLTDLLREMW